MKNFESIPLGIHSQETTQAEIEVPEAHQPPALLPVTDPVYENIYPLILRDRDTGRWFTQKDKKSGVVPLTGGSGQMIGAQIMRIGNQVIISPLNPDGSVDTSVPATVLPANATLGPNFPSKFRTDEGNYKKIGEVLEPDVLYNLDLEPLANQSVK